MEINKSNEELRKSVAILTQKLSLMEISAARHSPNSETRKYWERLKNKVEDRLAKLDDVLCRTEIVTKFDLMDLD